MVELKYLVDQVFEDNKDSFYTQKEIGEKIVKLKEEDIKQSGEDPKYSYSIKSIQPQLCQKD